MTHHIVDQHNRPISSGKIAAIRTKSALSSFGSPAYRGASQGSQELGLFRSPHLSASAANTFDRQIIADRVRDLVRNEPLAGTAVRKSVGMGIGAGWKLQSRPDAYALGISKKEARDLGKQIERYMRRRFDDPRHLFDATRRHDFGGQLRVLWAEWKTVNDVFVVMRKRENVQAGYQTCVQIVDTDRLSNPMGQIDDEFLRDGVCLDEYGAETGYHVRRAHPADLIASMKSYEWDYVPRETDWGRPVGIHGFRQQRAEETRGVSLFAPLIEQFVMLGKYTRAEIQSALLNAVMGAFVKSGFDPMTIAEILGTGKSHGDAMQGVQDVRMTMYETNPVEFDGVRIPVLAPGDDVSLNTAPRQASAYDQFQQTFPQGMAATLGTAHGQITGDYTGLNYSTLRGAYNEIYNEVEIERADFGTQLVKPMYLCGLEEGIDTDHIILPDGCASLWDEPSAWCLSNWIAPARGQIDPEKEAKADLLNIEGGIETRTRIAARRGYDLEEQIEEQAEELALYKEHKITPEFREGALAPTNPSHESASQ